MYIEDLGDETEDSSLIQEICKFLSSLRSVQLIYFATNKRLELTSEQFRMLLFEGFAKNVTVEVILCMDVLKEYECAFVLAEFVKQSQNVHAINLYDGYHTPYQTYDIIYDALPFNDTIRKFEQVFENGVLLWKTWCLAYFSVLKA